MKKTYYRSEYSDKQWKALVDKAMELGCQITYNKYGDHAEIDSADREDAVLQSTGKSVDDCSAQKLWAEHIHQMLQKSTDLRTYKVMPKGWDDPAYVPTVFKSREAAEHELELFERITGLEWAIIISE